MRGEDGKSTEEVRDGDTSIKWVILGVTTKERIIVEDGIKARVEGWVEIISGSTQDIVEKCERNEKTFSSNKTWQLI